LHGYPSLLALLAAFMVEQGLELGYIPRWITTGSETLLPQQSRIIQTAFGLRPLQHYGMVEAVANFSECTHGKLHVDEDFAAVEFIPEPDSTLHRVIGTNFTNPATPLLRYAVGDLVELEPEGCGCGLPGRVVRRVYGREEDYIVLRNGARVGNLDESLKDMVSIREAQIYQDTPGVLHLRVAKAATYTAADQAQLLRELDQRIGGQAEVHLEYVEHVERTPRGKLRFVISTLPEGQLASVG
jgi:phenylacetate-CoA ligase